MKNVVFTSILLFVFHFIYSHNYDNHMKEIENLIKEFVQAGDSRDVLKMDQLLEQNFRTVLNQAFGGTEIQTLDKSTYMQLLKDEKLGGDQRNFSIESVDIEGKNAFVKVTLTGTKMIFVSHLSLVLNEKGEWKIIQDLPNILKK